MSEKWKKSKKNVKIWLYLNYYYYCSQRILRDKEDLPATRVEPVDGTLFWLLDQEAGKLLNSDWNARWDKISPLLHYIDFMTFHTMYYDRLVTLTFSLNLSSALYFNVFFPFQFIIKVDRDICISVICSYQRRAKVTREKNWKFNFRLILLNNVVYIKMCKLCYCKSIYIL